MSKFVRCIDEQFSGLKYGEIYEVFEETEEYYYIDKDAFPDQGWYKFRFKEIKQSAPMTEQRKRQIERLANHAWTHYERAQSMLTRAQIGSTNPERIKDWLEYAKECQDTAADYYAIIAALRFED